MLGQGRLKADDTLRAPLPAAGLSSSGSVGKKITNSFALGSTKRDRCQVKSLKSGEAQQAAG
jgi:hypothetical protein